MIWKAHKQLKATHLEASLQLARTTAELQMVRAERDALAARLAELTTPEMVKPKRVRKAPAK